MPLKKKIYLFLTCWHFLQHVDGLQQQKICGSRRHHYPTQSSFYYENELSRTCNGCKFCTGGKFSRDVVVRSELASAGPTGASYPLSGLLLVLSISIFLWKLIINLVILTTYFFLTLNSEIWLNSKVRGICFYIVTALSAIILFVPMFLEHPFVLMFDRYRRKAHYIVAKMWAVLTVAPFVKIKYQGLENLPPKDTPAVYVSNHQSFLDIYALLTLGRSFKFISKTSVFLYPIIGWAMFLLGVIPLRRMDSRSQLVRGYFFYNNVFTSY